MHALDGRGDVTRALQAVQARAPYAADELFRLVQGDLRTRAGRLRRLIRRDPLAQTTVLVDDAFLRLCAERGPWQNRDHFYGVATTTLRRLLLDLARHRQRRKRGGGQRPVELEDHVAALLPDADVLIDLDAGLVRLGALKSRWRKIAEMRVYLGLDNQAIADALDVSLSTVEHDWAFVRAWLHRELRVGESG